MTTSVVEALQRTLRDLAAPRDAATPLGCAVALSGGRDSMVLLEATHRACDRTSFALSAVHVHHGLSPHADAWARFCAEECRRRAIPLCVLRVEVVRRGGESLEAAARRVRYAALLASNVPVLLLAHHADDQAETLLLQLLRGAGPPGLAAMPSSATRGETRVLRPFLDLPGRALGAYAEQQGLAWIDDESNRDVRFRRNALRHEIVPALHATFPGYPGTLVRAARQQAEAAELLDALAALDAERIGAIGESLTLDRAGFVALHDESRARARNVLRWFVRQHGLPAPTSARLAAVIAQCRGARDDARVLLRHGGARLGIHAGRIVVHRTPDPLPFAVPWRGERLLQLPGGTVEAIPDRGIGVAARLVTGTGFMLRPRSGGERLRLGVGRPRRSLTALFQAAGTPWWERDGWPLLWHDDELAAVPGLAVDARFAAPPDMPGYALQWRPRA